MHPCRGVWRPVCIIPRSAKSMSDRTLLILFGILDLLAFYNLYDTASAMLMHMSRLSSEAFGSIVRIKRAVRRDRFNVMFGGGRGGALNVYDINCDYIVDLRYRAQDGEEVFIKDFVIPSVMRMSAGSGSPIYREGQTLPLLVAKGLKKLVVVNLPEVRSRQCSWFWLILWILTLAMLLMITTSLIATLGS